MKSKGFRLAMGLLALVFIIASLIITLVEYNRYKSMPFEFPLGSKIGGIPVGGLEKQEVVSRLSEFFSLPLIIKVGEATIQAHSENLGLTIDTDIMVEEAADKVDAVGFWGYLWHQNIENPSEQPLIANVDEDQIVTYLNREIVPRYLEPGSSVTPIQGTTNFEIAVVGEQLNISQAVADIKEALLSATLHTITLQISETSEAKPSLATLQVFLQHNIGWIGFDELVEIYLESMDGHETRHFAVQDGQLVEPDIAFSAASTIKIPIMISVLRRTPEPTPDDVLTLFERMIVYSENPPADTLMETYLDSVRGPLIVSEDLAALGMENTFLAGYFYQGAPILDIFETPANTRSDIYLDPDTYNQTVPAEAGQLLSAIYTCAQDGSGLLTDTFGDEITQNECQLMIDFLAKNQIGLLIEAGLPPQASTAHKHGWVQELDGMLHSMSDVALVFTAGGDYVLNIFIYDPVRLDFDQGNRLFARVSQTVYNFFNIDDQAYWWFD